MRLAIVSALLLAASPAFAKGYGNCADGAGACVSQDTCYSNSVSDSACGDDQVCCTPGDTPPLEARGSHIVDARLQKRHYGCSWIVDNLCPGDNNVKYSLNYGGCWYISRGYCPGPSNYVRLEGLYP